MIPTPTEAALSVSQSAEISLLVKATAMLLIGLIAVALAKRTRASVRHLLLAATFAALIATPAIVIAVPETTIAIPVPPVAASVAPRIADAPVGTVATPAPSVSVPVQSASPVSWRAVAQLVWLTGALLFLAPLAIMLWKLRSLRRTGLPWPEMADAVRTLARDSGIDHGIDVLRHEGVITPITFGVWQPVILMPPNAAQWSDADLRRALVHEIEHVRRSDWIVHLAARTASAAYWFHPLAWVAWRKLVLEAERSCDDAVVAHEERTDYAEQLVTLAQRLTATPGAALGMAHRSDLAARVAALLDETRPRGRAGIGVAALTVVSALAMVLTLAPLRAVAVADSELATNRATSFQVNREDPQRTVRQPRRLRALDRELLEAAQSGDLEDVKDLIDAGANVDAEIHGDGSPLIAAARANRLAVVVELLNRGADVNLAVAGDGNPLIAAAAAGADRIVELLLSHGAAIDLMVEGDENALIQAAGAGHFAIVKMLVDRGADVNARSWEDQSWRSDGAKGEWRTPLSQARRGRHGAVVAFLLQAGARE